MEIKRDILWRVYLSFIGVVLLGLVVVGRSFYIQNVEGEYWRSLSDSLHQKIVELDAERGTIYSEDGQMLSTSIPYFDIYIDFGAEGLRDKKGKRFKENVDSFSLALSALFADKSAAQYKKELRLAYDKKQRYYPLKKALSFDQYKAFREMPLVRLGRNKSGVIAEVKSKRLNPFGLLAKRTIGLSREHAGNVGLELTYDSLLKGYKGQRLVRFISGGAAVPVDGYEIEPENGKDVMTTIDVDIQDIAETALLNMMQQSQSQSGTCIVMETKTGKIKAIANLGKNSSGSYDEDYNYALQTTEPGSTFKLATLLAVLDAGATTINDNVEIGTAGTANVGGIRNITDAERSPKAVLTVKEAFAHSSNIGMSKLALKAFAKNPDDFKSYLSRFNLDKKAGVGIVGEETPRIPKWKKNKEGLHAMLTASFGYAIEVSPMQTLMLYNAVANDGKMMRPYLVNSIKQDGKIIREFLPEVINEAICKPHVINAARKCMEAVTTEGTAKNVFKDFPFSVAGKTGTAHVASGKTKYSDGVYLASFAGYFPADAPEYSCIVIIRTKPHAAQHFGGQLAAPVFKEIATKLYAKYVAHKKTNPLHFTVDTTYEAFAGDAATMKYVMQNMKMKYNDLSKKENWSVMQTQQGRTAVKLMRMSEKYIPDVRSMSLKDALYALESLNIKVIAKGRGRVITQDILPGTAITKNQTINLQLN